MNNGDLDSFTECFDGFETYPQEKILWKIFYDCLKGLEYIHKEELIHRDIKPKNLFFDENLKIKIGDFNASMALSDNSAIKFSGSNDQNIYKQMLNDNEPVGTTNYQAPEIYGAYDEKVDVYSMGSTFFEICYLVAFFIIAPISNLIFNLLFSALKCRLDISCNKSEFNERKNFFNYLFSESRKVTIDINLMMF